MDFDFSEEQTALREAVQRWVERAYTFERRRSILTEGGFSRQAYGELADLGLCALTVHEDHGGLGMGPIEAMVVMEELGRGLVLEPLTHTLMASAVLQAHAPADLRSTCLPRLAGGEALITLAYQERAGRYQIKTCATHAQATDMGYVLNGAKQVVSAADRADAFIVPAMLEHAMALFLVPAQASGMQRSGYQTQDGSRAGDLSLTNTPADLICTDGLAALELAVDTGIASTCSLGVGMMDRALALTVDYLQTRRQFGAPLASFQALRHRVADMKMQVELARSMSYYASLKLLAAPTERRAAMARAKLQLGQSMRFVGQQAVQLHGGIGVTQEAPISHYFKSLTQLEMTFGDSLHQLGQVSLQMQDTAGVIT